MFLRQSTTQTIRFGPFLDNTDGFTAEPGLTIAQSDMQLSKDGGAFAQKNAAGNATHDTDGWYSTSLNTTDTNTVGELYLQVAVTGALPVWVRWQIVEEAVYDSMYASGATGPLQPTVAGRTLDVAADGAIEVVEQVENVQVNGPGSISSLTFQANSITNGAFADNAIGVNEIADNTITNAKIANGAIGTAEFQVGAIDASVLADNAITNAKIDAGAITSSEAPNLDAAVSTRATPAQVNTECDTALSDIHLDHLFAVDYDPAAIPGNAGAWANELTEDDGGGNLRYTAKALEHTASSGGNFVTGTWVFSTNTAATDPGAGWIKVNNTNYSSVTEVYVNQITSTLFNAAEFIEALKSGDSITISQENDGANYMRLDVTGTPTDNGGWYTISVTADEVGSAIGNGQTVKVTFGYAGSAGLSQQDVRDAMKLAASAGAPATDSIDDKIDARATPAQVNDEMVDVMDTDTITLPGQTAPPGAPTHRQAIAWLYKVFRNRKQQTASEWRLMADNETTVDAKATVSDDGTTATKQEIVSGP